MSLSVLFEDDTVLFLDAVTNYTKSRSSRISENPVDKARVITDHVSKDNLVMNIKGVVSSADFHSEYARPTQFVQDYQHQVASEYNQPVSELEIQSGDSLLDLLPGSIRQFMSEDTTTQGVSGDTFRGYSHEAARDRLNLAWEKSEKLTILDYDYDIHIGRTINVRVFENCLIDKLTDTEDSKTGDSYHFTMTLKKVRFATVKEVEVDVASEEVSDASAPKANKGNRTEQGEGEEDSVAKEEAKTVFGEDYRDTLRGVYDLTVGSLF